MGGTSWKGAGKTNSIRVLAVYAPEKPPPYFLVFLGPQPRNIEVPGVGVKLELQLEVYATAIATPDPSHICDLHHSSRQRQILNPLSKARDRTHILMGTSWVHYC